MTFRVEEYQFGLRPREYKENNRSRPSGANRMFNPASNVQDATNRLLVASRGTLLRTVVPRNGGSIN